MSSAKEVVARIRLVVNAGGAKPAPPVGPALGQAGLNIMAFCKDFNAKTAEYQVRECYTLAVYTKRISEDKIDKMALIYR